jgi:hypothetical protein
MGPLRFNFFGWYGLLKYGADYWLGRQASVMSIFVLSINHTQDHGGGGAKDRKPI